MAEQILDPASEAEAELASAATACLMTALDHSKADAIKVTIEVDACHVGEPPVLMVPPRALHLFAGILRQMAKREPMVFMPHKTELTTQQAAAFLNVSRPFVIKEIEAGRLKCTFVNRHRRIEFEEVIRYRAEQKTRADEALRAVSKLSEAIGQEL